MYTLSERLKVIADKITGGRVADIGTDHAYLPIYLIKTGKASRVLACDIKEKPLQNAAKNIQKTNTENIELRLSDGLAGVGADEADTIVIAGMGGEVIAGILNRCEWIKSPGYKLLLQKRKCFLCATQRDRCFGIRKNQLHRKTRLLWGKNNRRNEYRQHHSFLKSL